MWSDFTNKIRAQVNIPEPPITNNKVIVCKWCIWWSLSWGHVHVVGESKTVDTMSKKCREAPIEEKMSQIPFHTPNGSNKTSVSFSNMSQNNVFWNNNIFLSSWKQLLLQAKLTTTFLMPAKRLLTANEIKTQDKWQENIRRFVCPRHISCLAFQ